MSIEATHSFFHCSQLLDILYQSIYIVFFCAVIFSANAALLVDQEERAAVNKAIGLCLVFHSGREIAGLCYFINRVFLSGDEMPPFAFHSQTLCKVAQECH